MPRKTADGKLILHLKHFPDVSLKALYKGLYEAIEIEEMFEIEDMRVCQAVKIELEKRGYILPDGYPYIIMKDRAMGRCVEIDRFKREAARKR